MADSRGRAGKSRASKVKKHPSNASSDRGLKKKLSSDGTSDNEVQKHPSDASSDEESSGGSNDSEVKTDPNNGSRNKDLSESFKGLKVSETTYGNETPQ